MNMTKHRVTFVHKVSNARADNGCLLFEVWALDIDAIRGAKSHRALAKTLREQGILLPGARVRDARVNGDLLHVFPSLPGLSTYHHCVTIQLAETYDTCRPGAQR